MLLPKPKTYRSEKYKAFVRKQPCIACGRSPCDHHHTDVGGMGMKGTDLSGVPLDREHHSEIESMGLTWFERAYNVCVRDELIRTLQAYIEELEGKD
jgi:hypothetical protein